MNDKFFDVTKEKQDRMINGAMKIFALDGYKHAATDDMVKEAHVSKGLIFHYFGSKAGIYNFLLEYAYRYFALEVDSFVMKDEHDPVRILRQYVRGMVNAMRTYPYIQLFLHRTQTEQVAELELTGEESKEKYRQLIVRMKEQAGILVPDEITDRKLRMFTACLFAEMEHRLEQVDENRPLSYEDLYMELMEQISELFE